MNCELHEAWGQNWVLFKIALILLSRSIDLLNEKRVGACLASLSNQ